MDLIPVLEDFIDELLGAHGAYAITDIAALNDPSDADAFVRLRVRICEGLLADGWTPGPAAAEQLERDRQLLAETADETKVPGATHVPTTSAPSPRDGERPTEAPPTDEAEQMRRALASRAVIEQAKGIAMERYGLPAEVAWSFLVRTSQNRNLKVRVVAEELVNSISSARQSNGDGHANGSSNGHVSAPMMSRPQS